jgi:hypothetical protein
MRLSGSNTYGASNPGFEYLWRPVVGNQASSQMTFAWAWSTAQSYLGGICGWMDGGTKQLAVRANADSTLSVLRGGWATGVVLATSAPIYGLLTGNFNVLDIIVTWSTTVGSVQIYINNNPAPVINLTNVNTSASGNAKATGEYLGYAENITFSLGTQGAQTLNLWYDDFCESDASGRVGAPTVLCQLPNGVGTTTQWTRYPSIGKDCAPGAYAAISSGGGTLTNAFDSNDTTELDLTGNANAVTAYAGVNFNAGKSIYGYRLLQSSTAANAATAYKIQGSANGSSWSDVYTVASGAGADSGPVAFSTASYQYWRILATAGGSSSWHIFSIEFYDNDTSNFTAVDDAQDTGDTDYVSTTGSGNIDTYAIQDLTPTVGTVLSVVVNMVVRDDAGGSPTVQGVVRSGGTNYLGTAQNTSSGYNDLQEMYDVDPATGVAWTISGVNSAEAGIKKV